VVGRRWAAEEGAGAPPSLPSRRGEAHTTLSTRRVHGSLNWVPEGNLAKNFRAGFPGFSAENRPRDPPRSPGPAPHINLHQKSAPQTNSKAVSWRTKNPARLPSGTQLKRGVRGKAWVYPSRGVCFLGFKTGCVLVCIGAFWFEAGFRRPSGARRAPKRPSETSFESEKTKQTKQKQS